jgi:serine/threonine-protein kinase
LRTGVELPGAVFAGKFQLIEMLGRGGMGSVWKAQDLLLGRLIAIKFIRLVRGADDEEAMAEARVRFEREARAAAQIRSRHVVQIYEYGFDGDVPYIAMELLTGETLSQRLDRMGRLAPADAARIMEQVAKALDPAHAAGIVHRDLKPANIFLAREDNEEVVKILDFGVAKAAGQDLDGETTATGRLVGSPYYMSPEQARGSRVLDGRSDLWSIGVILFRALTGQKAFAGDSLGAVMVQILTEPIPRPSEMAPDLPWQIDRFFERALAREASHRFQTAGEMARAFSAAALVLSSDVWPVAPDRALTPSTPWHTSSGLLPMPPPSAAPLSVPARRMQDAGGMSQSGTLGPLPASSGGRGVLWGAAGAGAALAVVGLLLIARVTMQDPRPGEAPAPGAAPSAQATQSAAPTPPDAPRDDRAAPAGGSTADPGAPAPASTSAPTASASAAQPTAPTPPVTRPTGPRPKPKWY